MGSLVFVGLGLGSGGMSLEGVSEGRSAEKFYLEYYTNPHEPALLSAVEAAVGKAAVVVDRAFVEDGRTILREAKSAKVVLAVPGDPMIATTHNDLRTRAIREGIQTRVVHAATIASAAASASGLHFYKFSKTATVTRENVDNLDEVYRTIHSNILSGAHTLLLLEVDVESGRGVDPGRAVEGLLKAEANLKRGVVGQDTFALVLSRVGRTDEKLRAGRISQLAKEAYGGPPHCLVVPGRLHFTEVEAVSAIFGLPEASVGDNSSALKRTAQTLVPRYVEKTRRALRGLEGKLGPEYSEVLENAELYVRDAESFLAKGEDELAMLSVGYAEGLLDSLNFSGVAKVEW